MTLNFIPEVSIGDLLTIFSILITLIALYRSWQKDRQLKRKEYADRIRKSAGLTVAKIERWKAVSLSFFYRIQPIITDADIKFSSQKDAIATRDFLWRELVNARANVLEKITDEQIEIAYADLYGYDPRIQKLFSHTVETLKLIDNSIFDMILDLTQNDVLKLSNWQNSPSAQLGNLLRATVKIVFFEHNKLMDSVIAPFRDEMTKLIESDDLAVTNKKIKFAFYESALPNVTKNQLEILSLLKGFLSESQLAEISQIGADKYTIQHIQACGGG